MQIDFKRYYLFKTEATKPPRIERTNEIIEDIGARKWKKEKTPVQQTFNQDMYRYDLRLNVDLCVNLGFTLVLN